MAGEIALAHERNEEDDLLLVNRLKKGDEVAFNLLFNKYRTLVYSICFRFSRNTADAQDLTQEIFVKVYRKINSYDSRAKFSTWLYRVTVNHCISFKRKEKTLPYSECVKDDPDFTKQVEFKKSIDQAILQLPKQQRIVFVLRHFNQFSFDEIGRSLRISTGAAKAHHHFAVIKLKVSLSKLGY